jgi:Serine dehydrogenase proteinase
MSNTPDSKDSDKNKNKSKDKSSTKKKTVKTPPIMYEDSQKLIEKIEKLLKCPLLVYYKSNSSNIWYEDLYGILECLKKIGKQKRLALFIRSSGGSSMTSLRIVNLLRSYADELILLAPSECASAATMIALGCDEIHMGPVSSLSPVDSSLTHSLSPLDSDKNKVPVSLDELWRVIRLWQEADTKIVSKINPSLDQEIDHKIEQENPYKYLYQYIHPLVFGSVDRYSSLSKRICHDILSYHVDDEELIEQINHKLNYDYPAHGYPITLREAKKIGLPALPMAENILDLINELVLVYSHVTNTFVTDYDNTSYHNNSVLSVIETQERQVRYQYNYDKVYIENQKKYITVNDDSSWILYNKNSKGKLEKVHLNFN